MIPAVLGIIVLAVGVSAVGAFAFGWLFMLLVGVVHAEWLPGLPTIGYWWAVLIIFMLRLCFLSISGDKD